MGSIFLQACQKVFPDVQITATINSDESKEKLQEKFSDAEVLQDNKQAVDGSDLIILAVKPQEFLEVAEEIKESLNQDVLIMSVMAGVKVEKIQNELRVKKVIRIMPNLCAKVGKSMTAWVSSGEVGEKNKEVVKKILSSIGKEIEVENDEKIDRATAVAGSGPGFFFAVVEEWLKAVEGFGFSSEEAKGLLLQTIDGSNDLLQKEKKVTQLREQVTSKGGVTEAGLEVLQNAELEGLWKEVLDKAFERVIELSNT